MTDTSKPDQKAIIGAFNEAIRDQRNLRRVQVSPSMSRAELNAALRVAGGHGPQHTDEEPGGTSPWRSLGSRDGDA